MNIKELAKNWIENDRTGNYQRKITLSEAETFIGYMDPDTDIPEDLTPDTFINAWNELIEEDCHA